MFRTVCILARLTPKNLLGRQISVLLPAFLKLENCALYVHVILIVPIQYKKSPIQSEFMLLYLMSDR